MVDSGWVLLEPVGSVGNRLAAIASARLLAHDLNRELVLDWRLTPECCCPWEQLVESAYRVRVLRGGGRVPRPDPEPKSFSFNCGSLGALVSSEATPQKPENDEEEEPALCAGAELLRLWGLLRRSAKHEDLLKQGLERLNSRHLALFREGLAHLIDVSSARWRGLKRFKDTGTLFKVFGSDQVACLCIRAFDFFYPPGPKEREHANTVKELGQSLRTIAFAQGVRERVVEAVPGSVGIYVPQAVSNIGRHAFSPVHWLEMELAVFSLRTLLLVTDDPRVEEHFTRLYSIRLKTVFKKQRRNRSQPEHVQDSLAQLLTLAKCDRLFGTQGCIDLRLAAVLTGRSIQVDTVFYEEEDTQDEVEVTLANPVHPRGPFFLAGSWNDWKDFTQLMPSNNASEFAYSASISANELAKIKLERDDDKGDIDALMDSAPTEVASEGQDIEQLKAKKEGLEKAVSALKQSGQSGDLIQPLQRQIDQLATKLLPQNPRKSFNQATQHSTECQERVSVAKTKLEAARARVAELEKDLEGKEQEAAAAEKVKARFYAALKSEMEGKDPEKEAKPAVGADASEAAEPSASVVKACDSLKGILRDQIPIDDAPEWRKGLEDVLSVLLSAVAPQSAASAHLGKRAAAEDGTKEAETRRGNSRQRTG